MADECRAEDQNQGAPDGANPNWTQGPRETPREWLASIAYHYGDCDTSHTPGGPAFEEMFQCGELLEHCQALRDSATGMGDPLRHPEWIRNYIRARLDKWREPTDEWDGHVRALCGYALANYHPDAGGAP